MKKGFSKGGICIILAALLIAYQFSGISFKLGSGTQVKAATTYGWNNVIPEKKPAGGGNGKLVLFDNSHGSTTGAADWVLDGGFSDFADALVAQGYTVREYRGIDKNGDGAIRYYDDRQSGNVALNEAIITYDGIKDASVFVIAEANRPLRISEYAALKQFVDSGKGIYFIADHYNADRNMNTWDSTEVYNGYNRSTSTTYNMGGEFGDMRNPGVATSGWLAQNFGLRFRFNAIDYTNGVSGVRSTTDSEGITSGVGPILMAAGSTLAIVDPNKAKGIVYFGASDTPTKWGSAADQGLYFGGEAEGPYVAISKPSAGKAAFIGDSSPIEDITPKYKREDSGGTKTTYNGWKDAGNAATLSVNIVNWLARSESYVGFDGVNHTKGVATSTPMASVETNIQQAEPWAAPSYDPWNTDTFAYGAYNAASGPQGATPTPTPGTGTATPTPTPGGSTPTPTPTPSGGSDLIISEYVEGSSNNKALEIYNGTGASVSLSSYTLENYANGATTATATLTLSGTLVSGGTYIIVNSLASSTLLAKANLTSSNSVVAFNGNDAIVLKHSGTIIDSIGQKGYDPGSAGWGTGSVTTTDHTLVRKSTITSGDTNASDAFDPTVQWTGYAVDTFTYLGSR